MPDARLQRTRAALPPGFQFGDGQTCDTCGGPCVHDRVSAPFDFYAHVKPCGQYVRPADPHFFVDGEPPCATCQFMRQVHHKKSSNLR